MHSEDEAIIVHRQKYSETSLLITWISKHHGLIKTIAKGANRPKQKFFGQLDLFYECHIQFKKSRTSSLSTLAESSLKKSHRQITLSYSRHLAATYFYELISLFAETDTHLGELYELYQKALSYLNENDPSWKLIQRYERRLLIIQGLNDEKKNLQELRLHTYPKTPRTFRLLEKELQKS